MEQYDIARDRMQIAEEMANSDEIDRLTAQICLYDRESILRFGTQCGEMHLDETGRAVAKAAQTDKAALLDELSTVMRALRDGPGRRGLFGRAREDTEYYDELAHKLDGAYIRTQEYASQLRASCSELSRLINETAARFRELEKYILASEQGCREIREYMAQQGIREALSPEQSALDALERRVLELRATETIYLQTVPGYCAVLRAQQKQLDQIDNAFLATIPLLRAEIDSAADRKRDRLRQEALAHVYKRAGLRVSAAAVAHSANFEEAKRAFIDGITELAHEK